ncbi:hypothetical protein CDQ84_13240 [Clostridium thermosuccinogenes]|jgi:iron complex transport system substrate-binding protein|uniref:Fe/B12 periplasmic-binding domain-containing protein n=1 Tax=Clostridium thermosuccinogenes TaxID=84032 RepID=A0A2K2FB48_9CLOT|nr:ABC transporter substrate-binding protein [Pseudoclostridium thermosuccinogenes]AUS98540.1 hypothetical protein CDO33_20045 [Pseudoclostridium thermosuccinogenes]PNT90799.1 hypothetical protein CDQ83_13175 [Pseudoclostridium thermosuccinogenes]PNT95984.1 hypothetical protein CDQ85_13110 [Pseudoclostridium thermosuccinogenes]PNT97411.1 hypothetical protein CDQ84_13240 [Pseudoclostridium thermosuccinogenes]
MKRIISLLIVIMMTVGIVAGCGQNAGNGTMNEKSSESSVAPENTGESQDGSDQSAGTAENQEEAVTDEFPLTVKDAGGFEMTIEKKPEKIASLTLGTDEMLLSLVDSSRIVALSSMADMEGTSNIVEEAKAFPNKISSQSLETIISLSPDLLFASSWTDVNLLEQLRDAGIVVYCYESPNSIDQQKDTIREIAKLVGEKEKGEELIAWMDQKLKEVEDKIKSLKEDEKLSALYYDSSTYTYGKNTSFDDVVTRAGMRNVVSEAGLDGWPQISKEEIVKLNPDVIIVPSVSWTEQTPEAFAEELRKDPGLKEVSAVKNNRVFIISDAHRSAISQYIVYGVEDLAKAAYPDLFK